MERLNKHRDKIKVLFFVLVACAVICSIEDMFWMYIIFSISSLIFLPFLILSLHRKEEILEHSVKYVLLTDVRFVRCLLVIAGHMIMFIPWMVVGKYYLITTIIYWGTILSVWVGLPEYLIKKYSEKGGE